MGVVLDSLYLALGGRLVIDAHSLGNTVYAKHCSGITQVCHIAHPSESLLTHKDQAASTASVTCSNQFQLIIGFCQSTGDHILYASLLIQLAFENLPQCTRTFGMT